MAWVLAIENNGLEEVRKIPGFHDEPLQGKLKGYRSIRLNRAWRAYYRLVKNGIEFVSLERVDKHVY